MPSGDVSHLVVFHKRHTSNSRGLLAEDHPQSLPVPQAKQRRRASYRYFLFYYLNF
jgi:hypothetical protein